VPGTTFFRAVFSAVVLLFASTAAIAQTAPPQGGGNQGPSNSGTSGTRSRTLPDPSADPSPDATRPIYLSGLVRLPDGSIPPATVVIERVCGGSVRPEGYTDASGRFSFMVANQNSGVFMDASVPGDAITRSAIAGRPATADRQLAGCEIRGNLSGFISESIVLGLRRAMDNPNIGTIIIRPLESVQGYTFSITTAAASKDAQKAYERGIDHAKKKKWTEAERELVKAVETYPKYALAWFELGRVYHQEKKLDEARRAYRQALQTDSKFISPYGPLIAMNAADRKWQDVLNDSSQMLKLNPYVGADIYFYDAVANYNLDHIDVAEDHARQAAKLDAQHRIPKINHLLGVILAEKKDYEAARENIQLYLKYSPNAPDAATAAQLLAELDSAAK
jgi:tetratricopeptide (TPR) repeat protein